MWLLLSETYGVELGSGAEDSVTSGGGRADRGTGRSVLGTPKWTVLLRRDARREEMCRRWEGRSRGLQLQ